MAKPMRLAEPGARPKLVRPSEEIRRLSLILADELLGWPDVRMRPMFGLKAFFRGKQIFALLPDKRAPGVPNGIAFKRWALTTAGKGHWLVFPIEEETGPAEAISLFKRAYSEVGHLRRKLPVSRGST